MKKRMSKILSVLMVSALVVSTGNVARADELNQPEAQETEVQAVEQPLEETDVEADDMTDVLSVEDETDETESVGENEIEAVIQEEAEDGLVSEGSISETIDDEEELLKNPDMQKYLDSSDALVNDVYVNTIDTVAQAKAIRNDGSTLKESDIVYMIGEPFVSKAVKIKKGSLRIIAGGYVDSVYGSYVGVYKDAQMKQLVGKEIIVSKGAYSNKVMNIPATGNYYIGVRSTTASSSAEVPVNSIQLGLYSINGEDRTITNNKEMLVGQTDGGTVNYFKFKATYTGYLVTYTNTEAQQVTVTLCDSKKKALSGATSASLNPTYGVKKGKTYYIKLRNPYSNDYGFYAFKLTNKKISEKSGKTYKKAVSLKKKATKKGTIEAGTKQADWYKFTLTGKKSVNIAVTGGSNDEIKFVVYEKSGSKLKKIGTRSGYNNFTGNLKSSGKWSKGTYYVKVMPRNAKASGYYTLKWK